MPDLKGTKTIHNLMKAFAGESQARNRYAMFAGVAANEGYSQIERIFLETADNERVHANVFYEHIVKSLGRNNCISVNVNADYPVVLGDTLTNLKAAAAGEHEESSVVYIAFADEAEKEGFPEIAFHFRKVAEIETQHEKRYLKLAADVEKETFFKKNAPEERVCAKWVCAKCGYVHNNASAPAMCPVCDHPQGYFSIYATNY
ncbi:MAG: rubrerythrin family protein [Deferribacteraceae bacterium]|jgi:rubrerythrin|nr:rubrerythrin family protein [Deferribacteraceae bacterium]